MVGPFIAKALTGGNPQDHHLAHGIGQNAVEAKMFAQRTDLGRHLRTVEHAHIDVTQLSYNFV